MRRRLSGQIVSLTLALLLTGTVAHAAAPVFDAASSGAGNFVASITVSHTISGSDRVLWVYGATSDSLVTITGVTYNGVAMSADQTNAADGYNADFVLVAPATGTHDIVMSVLNANALFVRLVAASYTGVVQVNPLSGGVTANGNDTNPTWTVTSATGSLVVAGFRTGNGLSNTPGAGVSERVDSNALVEGDKAGAASVVIDWTLGTADAWIGIAASLAPSVPPATAVPRRVIVLP